MVQLYGSTAGNGVWVVPGTHKLGKVDIESMVEANGGSDRCGAGDMFICDRQLAHGRYVNVSPELRMTIKFGFHLRRCVLRAACGRSDHGQARHGVRRSAYSRTLAHDCARVRCTRAVLPW